MNIETAQPAVKKIRLIIYLPSLSPGGTERVVLSLCRNVSRERFDISVCAMTDGLFGCEIRSLGIPVTILSNPQSSNTSILAKIANYGRMLRTLWSIIGDNQYTVVHTHHYGPLLQIFLLRTLTRSHFGWIHTEHSWTDVRNAYALKLYRILNPMKGADVISGVAEKVTSYMAEVSGVVSDNAITVLNGIETERFRQVDREAKRLELGFGPEDIVLGTMGMLRQEKNQELAIRAFALVATKIQGIHLVVCGEGEKRAQLEQLTSEFGIEEHVQFLGFRMDAHEIMTTFDLYCLPSVYEGLPLSILEAWAARRPVVATDVVGTREIVHHEDNGLLVPLDDPKKMADAILRLLQDPSLGCRLADRGHEVVMAGFDVQQMVRHYEEIYEKIAC